MAKRIMYVEGFDGQVELMNDRVVIHRKGVLNFLRYGIGAKREIPIGAIAEVVFKDATILTVGKIEFVRAGRSQEERTNVDYSTVKFRKHSQPEFERLKEMIFQMVEQFMKQGR